MSEEGLLVRLSKYRPRESRSSLEDFITEAFVWLLQKDDDFQRAVLLEIAKKLSEKGKRLFITPEAIADWLTQESYKDSRFDMVAKLENAVIIFEHKVFALAYSDQIKKYLEQGLKYAKGKASYVVMITANQTQFIETADACLCWEDIYMVIDTFIPQETISTLAEQNLRGFQELLQYYGLGPAAPVSYQAIQVYPVVRSFETSLDDLFNRLRFRNWDFFTGFRVAAKLENRLGRIGLSFVGNDSGKWDPGFMLVVVLNGSDLQVDRQAKYNCELKLHLILSFIDLESHEFYPTTVEYQQLKKELETLSTRDGWQFYDQLGQLAKKSNKYHPLHMEYSLLELFQGATTIEQQVEQIYSETKKLIEEINTENGLRALQKMMAVRQSVPHP